MCISCFCNILPASSTVSKQGLCDHVDLLLELFNHRKTTFNCLRFNISFGRSFQYLFNAFFESKETGMHGLGIIADRTKCLPEQLRNVVRHVRGHACTDALTGGGCAAVVLGGDTAHTLSQTFNTHATFRNALSGRRPANKRQNAVCGILLYSCICCARCIMI